MTRWLRASRNTERQGGSVNNVNSVNGGNGREQSASQNRHDKIDEIDRNPSDALKAPISHKHGRGPSLDHDPVQSPHTDAACLIVDLFERIGLMDETGGQDVYDDAAQDLGYRDFDDAILTITSGWADRLRTCKHPAVMGARANWHWCEIAARLGWDTQALWGRFGGLIPRLRGEQICAVHRDYTKTTEGSTLMRCPRDQDPLIWED